MQTVKNLIEANNNKKLGNHKKEFYDEGQKYYYYETVICNVNHVDGTITLDKSYNTPSTTRAVNAYKRELELRYTTRNYKIIMIE